MLFCVCFFLFRFWLIASPTIDITPQSLDFGKIKEGKVVKKHFTISNIGDKNLEIVLRSSCGCMTVGEKKITITPGQKRKIILNFNTKGYSGNVRKEVTVHSNDLVNQEVYFHLYGFVNKAKEKKDAYLYKNLLITNNFHIDLIVNQDILYYFTYKNCNQCNVILNQIVDWVKKQNHQIYIHFYQLEDNINKKHITEMSNLIGYYPELPLVIYNNCYYSGKKTINNLLSDKPQLSDTNKRNKISKISVPVILLAGSLDGINPCVFTIILILISYLSLQFNKDRKLIFLSGIFYIAAVFITYFLIGIGLFEFIRKINTFQLIARYFKYVLSGILFVLAGLSVYDYFQLKNNQHDKVFLKLPTFLQKSVRKNIRSQMKNYNIFTGAIILGFTVSLFELACTGQIYFPIIGYMVNSNNKMLQGILLLFLYNIAFITPLLIIFFLIYKGVSSKKIENYFTTHMSSVKILFFALFISFGE